MIDEQAFVGDVLPYLRFTSYDTVRVDVDGGPVTQFRLELDDGVKLLVGFHHTGVAGTVSRERVDPPFWARDRGGPQDVQRRVFGRNVWYHRNKRNLVVHLIELDFEPHLQQGIDFFLRFYAWDPNHRARSEDGPRLGAIDAARASKNLALGGMAQLYTMLCENGA